MAKIQINGKSAIYIDGRTFYPRSIPYEIEDAYENYQLIEKLVKDGSVTIVEPFTSVESPPVTVGIPEGGKTGQVLTKKSDADFDIEWSTIAVSGGGGNSGGDGGGNGSVETNTITFYVDSSVAKSGDGTSWETAFKTIKEATTKLSSNVVYLGDINIYVKTGTYNEAIDLRSLNVRYLNIEPDGGNVTLTGTTLNSSASTTTSSILLTNCTGLVNIGGTSTSHRFVCNPTVYSKYEFGVYIVGCNFVTLKVTVNGTNWTSTQKFGVYAERTSIVKVVQATVSGMNYGFAAREGSRMVCDAVDGSGNASVFLAYFGGIIHRTTYFKCTGTAAVSKWDGGVVFSESGITL